MATLLGSGTAFSTTYIPDLADIADIQTALKQLYYGTTGGTLTTSAGIYGALYTLYSGNPTLAGNVTITGTLTVNGATTTINSTTLNVDDKLIELGSVTTPTNTTADGGGISLSGATAKTIIWDNANANWTTSENWNIASGKTLKINNATLLDTNAPKSMATLMGYTTTATAAGTTTLTNTSSYYQLFTGSTTQTVVLPVTSTLITGWTFHIANNSTGNLTIQSSGLNTLITIIPGTTAMVTCIATGGTGISDWEAGLTDFSTYTGSGNVVMATGPTITGPIYASQTYSTTQTLTTSNDIVHLTAPAIAWTLTLPTPTAGKILYLNRTDATANLITVSGHINGTAAASNTTWFPVSTANRRVMLVSNGTSWYPMIAGTVT
jgi:hypothetical protein